MALQDEGCLIVCEYVSVCQRVKGEKGRVWDRESRKRGRGSPWGLINQAWIEQEGPGGSCVGRQVSIAFWGRGYGQQHQSSHKTHKHTQTHAGLKLPRDKNPFPSLVAHYHVTAPCFIFGLVSNVKYCCDQIMEVKGVGGCFCKQFSIDYSAAYCVSPCLPHSLYKKKKTKAGSHLSAVVPQQH